MGKPGSNRFERNISDHALAKGVSLGFGLADDGPARPQDPDLLGVPALRDQGLIQIAALLRHQRHRLGQAEDMIGDMSGRAGTARRTAGLNDYRMPLRRGHHAEWPFHLEK